MVQILNEKNNPKLSKKQIKLKLKIENENKKIIEENKIKLKEQKKIIDELNKLMLESEYGKFCKNINIIFNEFNNNVKKILKEKNIKSRTKKITFQDALAYMFIYNQIGRTKDDVIAELHKNYKLDITRQSIDSKFKLIPIEAIQILFDKISILIKEYNITTEELTFIAVDGTFNHTNDKRTKGELQRSLNNSLYDVNNLYPLELKYYGNNDKKGEITVLKERLNLNNIKNAVLILDRAYYDKSLMLTLAEQGLFFIIRIKNNPKFTNETMTEQLKKINNKNINIDTFRIVEYEINTTKNCILENEEKCELEINNKFKIITNLNKDKYDDTKIKELYKKRWNIEVFFKHLKNNFKFSELKEYNEDNQYDKTYLISIIFIHLLIILEKIYIKNSNISDIIVKKDKSIVKTNIITNRTLLVDGINEIIFYIIKGQLTVEILQSIKKYFKPEKNEINRSFPLISITPYTKMYVRTSEINNNYNKIANSIMNNDISNLNNKLLQIANSSSVINLKTNVITKLINILPTVQNDIPIILNNDTIKLNNKPITI